MDNNITKVLCKHVAGYGDSLWIYRFGSLSERFHVDYTSNAIEWCNSKNMSVREVVTADNGKHYAIWTGDKFACALPIENEAATA